MRGLGYWERVSGSLLDDHRREGGLREKWASLGLQIAQLLHAADIDSQGQTPSAALYALKFTETLVIVFPPPRQKRT